METCKVVLDQVAGILLFSFVLHFVIISPLRNVSKFICKINICIFRDKKVSIVSIF